MSGVADTRQRRSLWCSPVVSPCPVCSEATKECPRWKALIPRSNTTTAGSEGRPHSHSYSSLKTIGIIFKLKNVLPCNYIAKRHHRHGKKNAPKMLIFQNFPGPLMKFQYIQGQEFLANSNIFQVFHYVYEPCVSACILTGRECVYTGLPVFVTHFARSQLSRLVTGETRLPLQTEQLKAISDSRSRWQTTVMGHHVL